MEPVTTPSTASIGANVTHPTSMASLGAVAALWTAPPTSVAEWVTKLIATGLCVYAVVANK